MLVPLKPKCLEEEKKEGEKTFCGNFFLPFCQIVKEIAAPAAAPAAAVAVGLHAILPKSSWPKVIWPTLQFDKTFMNKLLVA